MNNLFSDPILLSRIIVSGQALASVVIIFLFVRSVSKAKIKAESKPSPEKEQAAKLKEEINLLQEKLEKEKANSAMLESKLQELNKLKAENAKGLLAERELNSRRAEELKQIKKEYEGLKLRLSSEEVQKNTLLAKEKELKEKIETVRVLEKDKNELLLNSEKLNETIASLNKTIEGKSNIILELEKKIKESSLAAEAEASKKEKRLKVSREARKRKIGEILLARNLITEETLEKALEYQNQSGCGLTQYLLHYGYIDEAQLAECLCTQFAIPYLPLSSYEISEEIIKLVPVDIAQKYWLIPVDKQGDSLMVVMTDPLDNKAIQEVEEVTGLKIMPFVGIISEIAAALETYYKVLVYNGTRGKKTPPFFVKTENYTGFERRQAVRYNIKIDIRFPVRDSYEKSKTINVSRGGIAFESPADFPASAVVMLEVILPEEFSPFPIPVLVEVLRSKQLDKNKFEINSKIIKVSKQELSVIIDYASTRASNNLGN